MSDKLIRQVDTGATPSAGVTTGSQERGLRVLLSPPLISVTAKNARWKDRVPGTEPGDALILYPGGHLNKSLKCSKSYFLHQKNGRDKTHFALSHRVSWGLNGIMNVKHFINCKVPHKCEAFSFLIDEHTHAHTPTSTGAHSLKSTHSCTKEKSALCCDPLWNPMLGPPPALHPSWAITHLDWVGSGRLRRGWRASRRSRWVWSTDCSTHTCPFFLAFEFVCLSLTKRHVLTIETAHPLGGNACQCRANSG